MTADACCGACCTASCIALFRLLLLDCEATLRVALATTSRRCMQGCFACNETAADGESTAARMMPAKFVPSQAIRWKKQIVTTRRLETYAMTVWRLLRRRRSRLQLHSCVMRYFSPDLAPGR